MKKGALLVNTARSGLVDADAVLKSLADGRLAGYAVDAYETEPPVAYPLFAHERVITTPHVGGLHCRERGPGHESGRGQPPRRAQQRSVTTC